MDQTKLPNPYLTPRDIASRSNAFLAYCFVFAAAALTVVVSIFMVRSANGPRVQLRRNSMAVYNYTETGLTTTESLRSDTLKPESFKFKLGDQ